MCIYENQRQFALRMTEGYALGYEEGYREAQNIYMEALTDAIMRQPPSRIIVTTKEGLKKIEKESLV